MLRLHQRMQIEVLEYGEGLEGQAQIGIDVDQDGH